MGVRRNKYNSTKTVINGTTFDSKREAERWLMLKAREDLGEIHELRRQVEFELTTMSRVPAKANVHGFVTVGKYRADFVYWERGHMVVEDAKGMRTDTYKWKKRHFELEYDTTIREV